MIAQVTRAQFALGDMALEIEPMRAVGGSMPNDTDDLFSVTESLQLFADDIGVEVNDDEREPPPDRPGPLRGGLVRRGPR